LEHVWLVLFLLFIDCGLVLVKTEVGAGLTLVDVFLEFNAVSAVFSIAGDLEAWLFNGAERVTGFRVNYC